MLAPALRPHPPAPAHATAKTFSSNKTKARSSYKLEPRSESACRCAGRPVTDMQNINQAATQRQTQPRAEATNDAERVSALLVNPIAFHRAFVQLAGSVTAGLMLSQALYWTRIVLEKEPLRGGWFYKSAREWEEETGLTRREQETARKKLIKCGLLEEKLRGIPATLYYCVNLSRLAELLEALPPSRARAKQVALKVQTSAADSGAPAGTNAPDKFGGFRQTISETTAETTPEITHTPRAEPRGANREAPAARACVVGSKFSFAELVRYARNRPRITNPEGWAFAARRSGDFDELIEGWTLAQEQLTGTVPPSPSPRDVRACPDCGGSGWWYPGGPGKGIAKCKHARLGATPEMIGLIG